MRLSRGKNLQLLIQLTAHCRVQRPAFAFGLRRIRTSTTAKIGGPTRGRSGTRCVQSSSATAITIGPFQILWLALQVTLLPKAVLTARCLTRRPSANLEIKQDSLWQFCLMSEPPSDTFTQLNLLSVLVAVTSLSNGSAGWLRPSVLQVMSLMRC